MTLNPFLFPTMRQPPLWFGQFFSSFCNQACQVNFHGLAHAQHGFQGRITQPPFDIGNHLGRKAGFLRNKVLGEFSPLPFFPEQGNNPDTNSLAVSTHPPLLPEKRFDSVFHYSAILRHSRKSGRHTNVAISVWTKMVHLA